MADIFDRTIVNQIQQANDIVDVISEHVSLKKKGREMVGLCPFHDDHRPSMNVNPAKQIFKCFACGAGGSVFSFVRMRENLTFPQALQRLADRAGIKLPRTKNGAQLSARFGAGDPNELARVNAWAAKYFQQNLQDKSKGKHARDYLVGRKITSESIKHWQIGLAVSQNDLLRAAKVEKIPTKLLREAGLVVTQNGSLADKFVNRLMFTIADATGRIIGFGGRTLDDTGAKYINSPATALFDKSNALYGLQHARQHIISSGVAVVVEGYTDAIMAHQTGIANVVASLGTSFTQGQARILRRYAKKVVLLFDSDAAGIEAANRALEVCVSQRIDIKLASVPKGKDPCDFLLSAGRKAFEKLLGSAVDVFEFKWNRLMESLGTTDTLIDHKAAVEEFLQTIATAAWAGRVPAIDRGIIVNRLSKIIGTTSKQINAELSRRMARVARNASYRDSAAPNRKTRSVPADLGQGLYATAQREVLEVLLNEPKFFGIVKKQIMPEDFDVPVLRRLADIVFEAMNADPNPSLKNILAKAESVELGSLAVELAQAGEAKGNFKPRLDGALNAMLRLRSQRKKSEIKAVDNQTQFLRRFSENTPKENPHNVGMV